MEGGCLPATSHCGSLLPGAPRSPSTKARKKLSCREQRAEVKEGGVQVAPAQGKCPKIHTKATGFNCQLALWGRDVPEACSSPFVYPFTRLDVASQCHQLGLGCKRSQRDTNRLQNPEDSPRQILPHHIRRKKVNCGASDCHQSLGRVQGPWLNSWGCYLPINLPRTIIRQEGWDPRASHQVCFPVSGWPAHSKVVQDKEAGSPATLPIPSHPPWQHKDGEKRGGKGKKTSK